MILLVNLGSTLIFLFVLANLYIMYLVLHILSNFFPIIKCLMSALEKRLFWSWSLSLLMQQFQPLVMLSIINCYDMRFVTVLHIASAIVSFILLGGTQLITFMVWKKISSAKAAGKVESEKF
jgi:hypothetical protein